MEPLKRREGDTRVVKQRRHRIVNDKRGDGRYSEMVMTGYSLMFKRFDAGARLPGRLRFWAISRSGEDVGSRIAKRIPSPFAMAGHIGNKLEGLSI
jgi:hypothetical protein